jgi:hypothetical protein
VVMRRGPFRWSIAEPPGTVLMLTAAINLWLLPATLFFDAFSLPPKKPAIAEVAPLAPAAQRIRRKRKVIRSKRGD